MLSRRINMYLLILFMIPLISSDLNGVTYLFPRQYIEITNGILWSLNIKQNACISVILHDINKDGMLDIVIANCSTIFVVNGYNGKIITEIKYDKPYWISIYEINSSTYYYIFRQGYRLACFNSSGSMLWEDRLAIYKARLNIIDINKDNSPEIIVAPYSEKNLLVIDGINGEIETEIQIGKEFGYLNFADINNDEILDIIVAQRDRYLYAINGANFSVLWKINTYLALDCPFIIYYENISNPRILTVGYKGRKIEVFAGASGEPIKTIELPSTARIWSPPVIGDINGDGILDILVGSREVGGRDYKVYALDTQGNIIWTTDTYGTPTNFVLGDINGDNFLDVIAVDDAGFIYIYNGINGNLLWSYNTYSSFSVSPVVGDIDGDGLNEVVVATDNGWVYAFDFSPSGRRVYWGMFQGSADGWGNQLHIDSDLDLLSDYSEAHIGTNQSNKDSDLDGISDWFEVTRGLNPKINDTTQDYDEDGLSNLQEYIYVTDPFSNDTDKDGLPDGWETYYNLDPHNTTDRALDPDNDLLANWQEYGYGTDPWNPDTDGDGVSDGKEVYNGFNPLDPKNYPFVHKLDPSQLVIIGVGFFTIIFFISYGIYKRYKMKKYEEERKLNRILDLKAQKRVKLINKTLNMKFVNNLPAKQREALLLYINTGDTYLAMRLSGLKIDEFNELVRRAGIPVVVFYE